MKWEIGLSEQRQRGARLSSTSTEAAAATLNNNKSIFPPLNTAADDDDIIDNFSHSFQPFIQRGVKNRGDSMVRANTMRYNQLGGHDVDDRREMHWQISIVEFPSFVTQSTRLEKIWIFMDFLPLYVLFVIVECWMENRLIIQRLSFPLIEFVESVAKSSVLFLRWPIVPLIILALFHISTRMYQMCLVYSSYKRIWHRTEKCEQLMRF